MEGTGKVALHKKMVALVAEYDLYSRRLLAAVATASDGSRWLVGAERVAQARHGGWRRTVYPYVENEVAYRRDTWERPSGLGGIPIVVDAGSRMEWGL